MTSAPSTRPAGPVAPPAGPAAAGGTPPPAPERLPFVVYVLAAGTFLMLTTEFVVAGLLPEIADDLRISVTQAGLLITVFAVGMVVGAPVMALLTRRMPPRTTLVLALAVFAAGHVIVALGSSFPLLLASRFVTAWATGAFWALASVVAARAAGPRAGSRALGLIGAGGMLANVVGVPLGAFAGQLLGWRGPFWALGALALPAVWLIGRHVAKDGPGRPVPHRSELAALRSGRMWLMLAACATTTGGVLSTFSYIAPLLTDRAGIAAGLVPLVLVGFGVGSLVGSVLGGRLGDVRPHATTIGVATATAVILIALSVLSPYAWPTVVLVALLGLVGLSANPVLIALAVRFAGRAPTLAAALTVSAFNLGTAIGTWLAGHALQSGLGASGPAVVGAVIGALTLVPTVIVGLRQRAAARPDGDRHDHASARPPAPVAPAVG